MSLFLHPLEFLSVHTNIQTVNKANKANLKLQLRVTARQAHKAGEKHMEEIKFFMLSEQLVTN